MKVEMEWEVRVREVWPGDDAPPGRWEHHAKGATPEEALDRLSEHLNSLLTDSQVRLWSFVEAVRS